MSSLSKKNDAKKINWGVDTKDFKFVKALDLVEGQKYPFKGCFVTDDKKGYGESGVIISDGILVNVPEYFIDKIKDICLDPECIEDIKAGVAEFAITKAKSKKYGTDYAQITLF